MKSLLVCTRVVLVSPSLPENVGAVARAMGHFGLGDLVIAGDLDPTVERARTLAVGHDGILERAQRVPDFATAIAGCTLVIGTTARPQDTPDRRAVPPEAAAQLAMRYVTIAAPDAQDPEQQPTRPLALVFGPERTGLSNDELRACHQVATIPGEAEACLNLAQAAAILFHAWRTVSPDGAVPLSVALARDGQLDTLLAQLTALLDARQMLKPRERDSKLATLTRVLTRAALTPDEAAMLSALLAGGWPETRPRKPTIS